MADACKLIAIGASLGGTEAIFTVLKDLPIETPGILIVEHMMPGFTELYSTWLDERCKIRVKQAKHGDKVEMGLALIAPSELHMKLAFGGKDYRVQCVPGEKINGHCPSVDILFHSVAAVVGPAAIGVIMTGMGNDGAEGLLAMRKAGAFTIGQDEETSIVYGMPQAAFRMGAVVKQAPCKCISSILKIRLGIVERHL